MVPYPVPILPLVPIFHSFTYSYNLSNLIELPLIYSRAQLVELERMYECVRIAPNRPKIQVYKNIINHKFIFNYHYNSAHWSDRFKSVAIKDSRTAGVRLLVGLNGSSEIFVIFYFRNFRFSLNPSSSPVLSVRELEIFGLDPSWSRITQSFLVRSWSLDPGSCLVQTYLERFLWS